VEEFMVVTCKELSEIFDINYLQASSMVKMLIKTGAATALPVPVRGNGRGRPTVKYVLPNVATINFVTGKVKPVKVLLPDSSPREES